MKARRIAIAVLLVVLVARIFPVPTGPIGPRVLAKLAPEGSGFALKAKSVSWAFPFGAVLHDASLESGVTLRSPRLEIGISPWRLLTGKVIITSLEASRLSVRTSPTALGALRTLDALDSVPLGRWFPGGVVPSQVRVQELDVRSTEGGSLVAGRAVLLRRSGQDLSIEADSLRFFAVLAGTDFTATGRLPLALDTFELALPGGSLRGHLTIQGDQLRSRFKLDMDLAALPLGSAKAGGKVRCDSLQVFLPLSGKPVRMDGLLTGDSVWIADFSYGKDAWARQYAPELCRVGLGKVEIRPQGLEGDKLQIASFKASGDTLRLDAKGWIDLEGKVSLRAKVGMARRYALTRPGLLRAALQPGKDGFDQTSVHISGSFDRLNLAPTSEAIADAASNPFRTLGELFR
jgi:hypothetical protein